MQPFKETIDTLEIPEDEKGITAVNLMSNHTLIIDNNSNELKLVNNKNILKLTIRFQGDKMEVDIHADKLNLVTAEEINLNSKKITVNASDQLTLRSAGHFVQEVQKDALTEIGGINKLIAQVQKITANLGNVEIKANDDVKLDGESIKLNCEEP